MRRQDKRKLELQLLVSLLCSTPIAFWFTYYRHDFGRAFSALIAGTVFLFVAAQFWRQRRTLIFWVATLMAASIQIFMVLAIPWKISPHARGSGLMAVFVVPNLLVVYGTFKLAEKLAVKHSSDTDTRDHNRGMQHQIDVVKSTSRSLSRIGIPVTSNRNKRNWYLNNVRSTMRP